MRRNLSQGFEESFCFGIKKRQSQPAWPCFFSLASHHIHVILGAVTTILQTGGREQVRGKDPELFLLTLCSHWDNDSSYIPSDCLLRKTKPWCLNLQSRSPGTHSSGHDWLHAFELDTLGFMYQLSHLLAAWVWTSYLIPPSHLYPLWNENTTTAGENTKQVQPLWWVL